MASELIPNHMDRLKVIEALALSVHHCFSNYVTGDIAEFGTNRGWTASYIAKFITRSEERLAEKAIHYNRPAEQKRMLHLFDSFKGMPPATHDADKQSPHVLDGSWGEGNLSQLDTTKLLSTVGKYVDPKQILIYEGFFQQTLSTIKQGTVFAMVHIDCDLYQSTIEVLHHLFGERMIAEGAVILFDDWNCFRARDTAGERKAWIEATELYQVKSSEAQYYGSSGARFLIHDYHGMDQTSL